MDKWYGFLVMVFVGIIFIVLPIYWVVRTAVSEVSPIEEAFPEVYVVREGDTLPFIARELGLDPWELAVWNVIFYEELEEGLELILTGPSLAELEQVAAEAREYLRGRPDLNWSDRFLDFADIQSAYVLFLWEYPEGCIVEFGAFLTFGFSELHDWGPVNWEELAVRDIAEASGGFEVEGFAFKEELSPGVGLFTALLEVDGADGTLLVSFADINSRTGEIFWNYDWLGE